MSGSKKSRTLVMAIVFCMMLSLLPTSLVYAADTSVVTTLSAENVDVTRTVSKTKVLLNEEVTITYTLNPKDIPVEEQPLTKKEVFLVVDVSSSMKNNNIAPGKTRLKLAQEVAIKFLDNLAKINEKKPGSIKVGLILFSTTGTVKKYDGKVLQDNFAKIKQDINNLASQVSQGTNIGDGLRRAYYEATKGDPDAEKYIVLLSDGEASYFSGILYNYNQLLTLNGKVVFFTADGSDNLYPVQAFWNTYGDTKLEYCYVIGDMIKEYNDTHEKKIKPFMIAYGNEADKNVLDKTVKRAGGKSSDVYEATEADDLGKVFDTIEEAITRDYRISNLSYSEDIPDGFTVAVELDDVIIEGEKITKTVSSIEYKLNEAKTYYVADPVTFQFYLTCSIPGSQQFGGGEIKYNDIDDEVVTINLPPIDFEVYSNNAPISISRTITPTNTIVDSEVVSKYTITPGTFMVDPDLYGGTLPNIFTVSGIKLSEQLPAGITVNPDSLPSGFAVDADNNITANLPPIQYTRNAANQYVASEIVIEFPIIPTQTGTYQWEGNMDFTDLDGLPKNKSYTNDPINISEYGTPTIEVINVTRKGDLVDVKVKYTLPDYTAEAKMTRNNLSLVYIPNVATGYAEFKDLSIYETHTAKLAATSTTSVTRTIEQVIFEAINVN